MRADTGPRFSQEIPASPPSAKAKQGSRVFFLLSARFVNLRAHLAAADYVYVSYFLASFFMHWNRWFCPALQCLPVLWVSSGISLWFLICQHMYVPLDMYYINMYKYGKWTCAYKIHLDIFFLYFKVFFIFKDFIYLFLERGKGREKERERNINAWIIHQSGASCTSPPGDLAHNPGMCPNWDLNLRPFSSQASTQCTEAHQPGL